MSEALTVKLTADQGLQHSMHVRVPVERFADKVESRLLKKARHARIRGFRPGKAPMNIVRNQFQSSTRTEVISELMNDLLNEALGRHDIKVAGGIDLVQIDDSGEGDISIDVAFEVFPEVKPQYRKYKKIQLIRKQATVLDSDVDAALDRLLQERVQWQTVQRSPVTGDMTVFRHSATKSGDKKADFQKQTAIIGKTELDYAVEEHLKGMSAGESQQYTFEIPGQDDDSPLANRKLDIRLQLTEVKEPIVPPLDQELFASFKVADETELRELIRKQLGSQIRDAAENDLIGQIHDRLGKLHSELTVPKALIEYRLQSIKENIKHSLGIPADKELPEMGQKIVEDLHNRASSQVKIGLVVEQIIADNELSVSDEQLQREIADSTPHNSDSKQWLNYCMGNEQIKSRFKNIATEKKLVQYFEKTATVEEKEISCEQLLSAQQ